MRKKVTLPASYKNWEVDAAEFLTSYTHRYPVVSPSELVGRSFEKLSRQLIQSRKQLQSLMPYVVKQVLIDLARVRRREEARYSGVDPDDLMALSPNQLEEVHERLAYLLSPGSPLAPDEREILALALEHPEEFMRPSGEVRQSALGRRLKVDQKTIFNRWRSLRQKLARFSGPDFPSMGTP